MPTTFFAPQLSIPSGTIDIGFYQNGLGAVELRRFSSEDGSVHVAELEIGGALFHLHEEKPEAGYFPPGAHNGVTAIIGLFVPDVDALMASALAAGAREFSPAQDYDYGYRQGEIIDPFGHRWLIQTRIP